MSTNEFDSAALAERIAGLASDRKAIDIRDRPARDRLLHGLLRDLLGNTERQTKAIHDAIHEDLKHAHDRLLPRRIEGDRDARLILLDSGT